MENRKLISSRIRNLRKEHRLSQTQIADQLNISQAAYSLIESSQNGVVAEHLISLSEIFNVTTDFILKGDDSIVRVAPENGFIPYINQDAHAGFLESFHNKVHFDECEWYRIPGFDPSSDHKLFEVVGDSMTPTLLSGDVIICQDHKDIDKILDGSLVLIITKEEILVKRLRKHSDPDYFVLESDNHNEEITEMKMSKAEISHAMIVRGKISSGIVPHHELASKGKINNMEESIELLKKELYAMSKKVEALGNK